MLPGSRKWFVGVAAVVVAVVSSTAGTASASRVAKPYYPSGTWPQVFYRGTDGALWTTWRDYSGYWSVRRLGGAMAGNPVATSDPTSNNAVVYWRGNDDAIRSDERYSNGSWSGPQYLGGAALGDPSVATVVDNNGSSQLQLFYRGTDKGSGRDG